MIKFRAWDKFYECMITPAGIDLENGEVAHIIEQLPGETTKSSITYYELMQSTGLKDKNGVEIYEGDVIDKGYHNFSIKNRIGYVEFNKGGDSDGWAHGDWLGWITNNNDSLLDVHEHCTVLGNLYEHPHLIKE
ncbi:YopX family protein [Staphylococcus sp. 50Mo3-1]|uniref:YopX family protein n=1 Tax=Staphylococcus TaxID=1279 RepID=UPI0033DC158F